MRKTEPAQPGRPPALVALDDYPLLRAAVDASLTRQVARIAERTAPFCGLQPMLERIQQVLFSLGRGLVTLEGPPGSGVTTLLAHLASTNPFAFWLYDDDANEGAAALCAQLIALHKSHVPLIPPAAANNPNELARFLEDITAQHTGSHPVVLLIDGPTCRRQPRNPFPMVLPSSIPPRVVILYGCTPGTVLPFPPDVRLSLPIAEDASYQDQVQVLQAAGCPREAVDSLIESACGNRLYLKFAASLVREGILSRTALPQGGLDMLYSMWWEQLDSIGQRLALILAAAGEAMPIALCSELLRTEAQPLLDAWQSLALVEMRLEERDTGGDADDDMPPPAMLVRYAHWSPGDYLARQHASTLEQVHADMVSFAMQFPDLSMHIGICEAGPLGLLPEQEPAIRGYLARQFARHAALGTPYTRHTILPMVAQRAWIRNQERRSGTPLQASHDLQWELSIAAAFSSDQEPSGNEPPPDGEAGTRQPAFSPLLRLVHGAVLTSTLVSQTRTLSADAAVAALIVAIEHNGRERGLKQVMTVVDQLPDSMTKAHVLRQLGEACYANRMRASAMRLLSQAIDLEEQKFPQGWRDQYHSLLKVMVQESLTLEDIETALHICEYIAHVEQRGMAETLVVQRLLEGGELVRARKVAGAIAHESLHAWAMAEVVVQVARSGDHQTADMLLSDIQVETAHSWAQIELACDEVEWNEAEARSRIEKLDTDNQRDHGRMRLSYALALVGKSHQALEVASQIGDIGTRVAALLSLRGHLSDLMAMLALRQADAAIGGLPRDRRVPLIALLAAAYASLGRRDHGLRVAGQLPEGEERDRAFSRVAVALAQHGKSGEGLAMARRLEDDDERDWTLAELSGLLAECGRWQEAHARALEISNEPDRNRTLANLAIVFARQGAPLAALQLMRNIKNPHQRARTLAIIAPMLVLFHHTDSALSVYEGEKKSLKETDAHALSYAQINRFLSMLAVALAEHGNEERALLLLADISNPFDRAPVHLALARFAAKHGQERAVVALGEALCLATTGRTEVFPTLEQAVDVLGMGGGSRLLAHVAATMSEIDSW